VLWAAQLLPVSRVASCVLQMFLTCLEDRPLIVQFAANDTDTLVRAAKLVEPYCDGQNELWQRAELRH
jgi:tRNA-dihydrouridine synthase